jgi:hypothetical protein
METIIDARADLKLEGEIWQGTLFGTASPIRIMLGMVDHVSATSDRSVTRNASLLALVSSTAAHTATE